MRDLPLHACEGGESWGGGWGGLGGVPPHLLRRVGKPAGEMELPPVTDRLEASVHCDHLLRRRSGRPWPRDVSRDHRGATPTEAGTAPTTRRWRAAAPCGRGRGGAGPLIAPRRTPPPAGPAGAWTPRVG